MEVAKYRNKELVVKAAEKIRREAKGREFRIMHVCGTHENTIVRFGLRNLLPENVKVVSGPGCPVCVTPAEEIDLAAELSRKKNVILTTYGDMLKVPGVKTSLIKAKAKGGKIRVVYSVRDALKIAVENKDKEVVHFSIGFETTAPAPASIIYRNPPSNFSIICSHKLIPPAMIALVKAGETRIDGFINPGHVSTIIGVKAYEKVLKETGVPQVIAGFEPLDIMIAILMIVRQVNNGETKIENEYTRAVRYEGNVKAQEIMYEVFEKTTSNWRGIGKIEGSGLKLKEKYSKYDAIKKFDLKIEEHIEELVKGCKCGEIMRGVAVPTDCPYFAKKCTPINPIGPCMVTVEGPCAIWYKYGVKH